MDISNPKVSEFRLSDRGSCRTLIDNYQQSEENRKVLRKQMVETAVEQSPAAERV